MEHVKDAIGDDFVVIQVDETTDASGRMIAGITIQSLSRKHVGPFLVNVAELGATNHETMVEFVLSTLNCFYESKGKSKDSF